MIFRLCLVLTVLLATMSAVGLVFAPEWISALGFALGIWIIYFAFRYIFTGQLK